MFISQAFAQAAAPAAGPIGGLQEFLPIILMLGVAYFLILRPQMRKAKQHKEMVSQLRRGDKVVLESGIFGTITKVIDDETLQVEVAENVRLRVLRRAVGVVEGKPEPAAAKKGAKDAPKEEAKAEAPAVEAAGETEKK